MSWVRLTPFYSKIYHVYRYVFIHIGTGFQMVNSSAGILEQDKKINYIPSFSGSGPILFFPLCFSGHLDSCWLDYFTVMLAQSDWQEDIPLCDSKKSKFMVVSVVLLPFQLLRLQGIFCRVLWDNAQWVTLNCAGAIISDHEVGRDSSLRGKLLACF